MSRRCSPTGRPAGDVLAGDPGVAVPFGRVATDARRLARIEADRQRSTADLLGGIDAGLDPAVAFVAGLSTADGERRALHPVRGEMTVRGALELFLVSHLEEHLVQLRGILVGRRDPAPDGLTGPSTRTTGWGVLVLTGYSQDRAATVPSESAQVTQCARRGRDPFVLHQLKSQGFRIVLILSALASSALVLEAGQRWK